ncbi:hypothetical protein V8E53_009179 [Lactarius tabidus]
MTHRRHTRCAIHVLHDDGHAILPAFFCPLCRILRVVYIPIEASYTSELPNYTLYRQKLVAWHRRYNCDSQYRTFHTSLLPFAELVVAFFALNMSAYVPAYATHLLPITYTASYLSYLPLNRACHHPYSYYICTRQWAVPVTWIFNGCAMLTNDGTNATLWQIYSNTWASVIECPCYTSAASTPPFATRGIRRRLLGMQPYQHCGCATFSSLAGFMGPARAANKETKHVAVFHPRVTYTFRN